MSTRRSLTGFMTVLAVALLQVAAVRAAEPDAAAKPLPRQPWHVADLWWDFAEATPHFESLDIDVTIDRDVSTNVNLYVAPCGLGELNGIRFYGGLQSNANGWTSKTDRERFFIGKGGIFSRWGHGTLSVEQARGAEDSRFEAAGYEGDFVSVRRALVWSKGTYTWSLRACDVETVGTNVVASAVASPAHGEKACGNRRAAHIYVSTSELHRVQRFLRQMLSGGQGPDRLLGCEELHVAHSGGEYRRRTATRSWLWRVSR